MDKYKILINQIKKWYEEEHPNIYLEFDEKDITKASFVFCFMRGSKDDPSPFFIPNSIINEPIFVHGSISFRDYPSSPPTMHLNGDVPNCHVHPASDGYHICFSLDSSYQWFFSDPKSKFNPSITIENYIYAVYTFLADNDLDSHSMDMSRIDRAITFWGKNIPKKVPETLLSYYEMVHHINFKQDNKSNNSDKVSIFIKENKLDPTVDVNNLIDFVTKDMVVFSDDQIGIGLMYEFKQYKTKQGQQVTSREYKIASHDLLCRKTFDTGVRINSYGTPFKLFFPVVIHSSLWHKSKSIDQLKKLITGTLGTTESVQTIDYAQTGKHISATNLDHYIYVIANMFNNLAIQMFSGKVFPCEEILKCFASLHHILLILRSQTGTFDDKNNLIITTFEESLNNRRKNVTPNLGILLSIYLVATCEKNMDHLLNELFARNVLWCIKDSESSFAIKKNGHKKSISNFGKWMTVLGKTSRVGIQRFAFQQLYNNIFGKMTLEDFDTNLGQPTNDQMVKFQTEVKTILNWNNDDPMKMYMEFLNYFGITCTEKEVEIRLRNAFQSSENAKYH